MSNFEQEYYENEKFWEGDALGDAHNRDRIRKTIDFIPGDVKNLLDVGCGNGIFLNQIMEEGRPMEVFGLDRSHTALKYLKTPNKINGSIDAVPFPDASFDCVTCLEVIEHLPHTIFDKSLKELARVSKKYVIISVPFSEDIEQGYNRCPECFTVFNADLHLRSFGRDRMETLLRNHGFECKDIFTCGSTMVFKGHRTYTRMFFKKRHHAFRSPNCPVCGYQNSSFKSEVAATDTGAGNTAKPGLVRRMLQGVKALPKALWPKEKKDYWIVALYQKK
jgi:SAM-dependent methyltransferase